MAWLAIDDDGKAMEVRRAFEMLQLKWNGKPIEVWEKKIG